MHLHNSLLAHQALESSDLSSQKPDSPQKVHTTESACNLVSLETKKVFGRNPRGRKTNTSVKHIKVTAVLTLSVCSRSGTVTLSAAKRGYVHGQPDTKKQLFKAAGFPMG